MIDTLFRLDVLNSLGNFKNTLTVDGDRMTKVLNLQGGIGLEVEPLGLCREATFIGDPSTLGIRPRDWVDVFYSTDNAATWIPKYSGVAVQSANTDSLDPGPYKLMGGLLRLNEVEARLPLDQGDVGAQVRQAVEHARASGQLGAAILPTSIVTIPNIGGPVNGRTLPRFRNLGPLIKDTLVGQREGLVFGVNARREVVFGKPSGTLLLDEANGVVFEDTATNAEVLVTHVRVFFSQVVGGVVSTAVGAGRTAVTTIMKDAQTSVAAIAVELNPGTDYGQAWEKLPLTVDGSYFQCLAAGSTVNADPVVSIGPPGGSPSLGVTGSETTLWDNDRNTFATFTNSGDTQALQFSLTLHYPPGSVDTLPLGMEWAAENAQLLKVTLGASQGSVTVTNPTGSGGYLLFPSEVSDFLARIWPTGPFSLSFLIGFQDASKPMFIRAACLLSASLDALLPVVRSMLRLPAENPTKATVYDSGTRRAWDIPPTAALGELVRRYPDGTERSRITRPITLYRYQIDGDGEYVCQVAISEADAPEASAVAAIIARKDRQATVNAVMAT